MSGLTAATKRQRSLKRSKEGKSMKALTPVPLLPTDTLPVASVALQRLAALDITLTAELKEMPTPHDALLDAINTSDTARRDLETSSLLQRINDYWSAPGTSGETRYEQFLTGMSRALRDELSVKIHERKLAAEYALCMSPSIHRPGNMPATSVRTYALHVQFQDNELAEVAGALVMTQEQGSSMLVLPGLGATGFTSQQNMRETLAQWLNTPALKDALINNIEQRYRDLLADIDNDPDLYLEPFTADNLQLTLITTAPYTHAMDRLLNKQREDVRYVCALSALNNRKASKALIQKAIDMQGLFGPNAMLELRELSYRKSQYRKNLPDWIKIASQDDLNTWAGRLQQYEQARAAMLSALGVAASPKHFAEAQLRIRLANDLGYDLNPDAVIASTRRTLALTDESFTVTRSLVDMALCGLHPGDRTAGSEFLEHTTFALDGAALATEYSALTPAYVAQVIEELDLRVAFKAFQQAEHQKEYNQQLMRLLTHRQISTLAYVAKMQGQIRPEDFEIVEVAANPQQGMPDSGVKIQQIKLNNRHTLSRLLVFRKETTMGQLERLVMVALDAPGGQRVKAFYNETQLQHELVSWVLSNELCEYLLKQVEVATRPALEIQLAGLKLKPYPPENFLQLVTLPGFDAGLQIVAQMHVDIALAEQARHTPEWLQRASLAQRQELVALEDKASGALSNYKAQPHTRVQPFNEYVHARASQQISKLLNVPVGSVDPDLIVVTSERETLTYTQMLLNGYDDSISFTRTNADTQATFTGPDGVDLSRLTPMQVAGSVRGKWLGDDYIALVNSTLLNTASEGYEYRRKASVQITQLHMKAAALRSALKGHISAVQHQWLRDSIDHAHLSDTRTREQYPLFPLQIHVDKPFIASGLKGVDQLVIPDTNLIHVETVQGCFIVLPTSIRLAALLYTPHAPDEIEFRLFGSFTDSLKTPGMIDYYKDRCRIKSHKNLSFFLRDMQQGNANKPPFMPKESISNFADSCFNLPIRHKMRDVDETTTGRSEMMTKLIWMSVEIIATVVTLPFPPASFAVGALLSLHDTLRALQALREGDTNTASAYIIASVLNSLGAAGDLQSGLKGFGGLLHRSEKASRPPSTVRSIQRQNSLPRHEDLYPVTLHDETFLVGKPNTNGHFQVVRGSSQSSPEAIASQQFAIPTASGTWEPLGASTNATSHTLRNQLAINLSLHDIPRTLDGHGKGVCTLNGRHYIELSGKTWPVQYDAQIRCWQIIDPENPFAFFGKQPVRLDEQGQWQLIDRPRLLGGGLDDPQSYRPLPDQHEVPLQLSDYQLPLPMQPHLNSILSKELIDPTGMGLEGYFEPFFKEMRQVFATRREKLYRDANAFFLSPPLLPRLTPPALTPSTTIDTLIDTIFKHSNGLVLSEAPKSVASKRLLILNMPLLAEQRVEILYIEHLLLDRHTEKLARYYRLGKKSRAGSHEIKHYLDELNQRGLNNQTTEYDYYHLIKAAHRQGIEVRPFNSSISYSFLDHPIATASSDPAAARKMSNFFGHTLISGDVASDPSRRWIALLDEKLATTYDQLPGIAELEGVPSIHIKDIAAGRSTRISKTAADPTSGNLANHSDFTVELANPLLINTTPPLPESTILDMALHGDLASKQIIKDSERWAGEYGFQWSETDGWQHIAPEQWSPDSSLTAIQQSLADITYEMPLKDRSALYQLAHFENKGMDSNYITVNSAQSTVRSDFFALRRKLQADAFNVTAIEQPVRPTLPVVSPTVQMPEFIETLYQHTHGVVIGESHHSIASKKLIIDNLPLLSQKNVKTLYLEHLQTDLHQIDLDRFFESGQMSKGLLYELRQLDRGHRTDPSGIYTFERLVLKARLHGMEIRAIDCAASYHLSGLGNKTITTRQHMMNYFASRTIRKHQEVMGPHKWISLVGNSHSNNYQQIVPGIAELEGGIGLNVVDVAPGHSRGIMADPGERVRLPMKTDTVFIKADYRVEMEIPGTSHTLRPAQPIPVEQRLSHPGMFLIKQSENELPTVVHRSRDTQIHYTPVRLNAQGKIYLERPSWTGVHSTPYDNIDALVAALEELNLTRVT